MRACCNTPLKGALKPRGEGRAPGGRHSAGAALCGGGRLSGGIGKHHAHGEASPAIADEFLVHANEESAHADKIAERIVQLGGEPDFNPQSLQGRSHASYDASLDLQAMVRANLVAERIAIETYRQMIVLIGDKDPTTRRMLEEILSDEEEHADELKDWLGH